MSELPNAVVGEPVNLSIGPLEADLKILSFEPEWTGLTYKPNRVRVEGVSTTSNRREGIIGRVEFTVTFDEWRRLNRETVAETERSREGETP